MEGTLPSVHAVFQSRRYSSSQIKERSTIQRFMRKVYNSPLASIPASGLRMPISFRPNFLIQNLVDIPLLYCAGLVFVPYRCDRFSAVKRWVSEINVVFFRLAVFDKTEGFADTIKVKWITKSRQHSFKWSFDKFTTFLCIYQSAIAAICFLWRS